ncbi:MAG: phosphatase PAP2 family protein [Bryobacteraceae bacterium]|nr:phosphatase PAP2 family protein [Bryobacteraceae bacterium]
MTILWNSALKQKPTLFFPSPCCPEHITFYRKEDDADWFNLYHYYDPLLEPELRETFRRIQEERGFSKCGTTHLQIKVRFQRPRPFQVATLLGKQGVRPLRSISAGSSALCSGHAFQALLSLGAVAEYVYLNNIPLTSSSHKALRQLAVDIGDRRVFAAIHNPSDNIASWILAMSLADHVFRIREVKRWLWTAIVKQSLVYRVVEQEEAFASSLHLLREVAGDIRFVAH